MPMALAVIVTLGLVLVGVAPVSSPIDISASETPFAAPAEVGEIPWIRQFGSSGDDGAFGIASHASRVYVAGETHGTFPGQTEYGGAFVRKYDSDGNEVWTRQFGVGGIQAFGVAVDTSGVYVAGWTDGTFPGQASAGGNDAFVRRYDVNGNEMWTRQFGTSGSDIAQAVALDGGAVLYVVGYTFGAFPGQTNAGAYDAFVRAYDIGGNEIWTRQFGSWNVDRAYAVTVDTSGVYVAGWAAAALPGQSTDGAFARKYNVDGNEIWTRQFGGATPTGIAGGPSGVYVAGLVPEGALPGQTSSGGLDAFVRKYDADGNEMWTRQFGTTTGEWALGVTASSSGIYVAGETLGAFSSKTSAGGMDAFVREYDIDGNEMWTTQFGTPGDDRGLGVAVDDSGVYLAGGTGGIFPGQTSAGGSDAFVAKLSLGAGVSPLQLSMAASPVTGTTPLAVSFSSTVSGGTPPYAYAWTFGDGSSSTVANPSHTYQSAGSYAVSLEVTDSSGAQKSSTLSVTVVASPAIEISADATTGTIPFTVAFTASPSGGTPPYSFLWDFGDGNTSTLQNPVHTFATAGFYTVTLTITDGDGRTTSKAIPITVEGPPVDGGGMPSWVLYSAIGAAVIAVVGAAVWWRFRRSRAPPPSQ